jgi:hypothetical protein
MEKLFCGETQLEIIQITSEEASPRVLKQGDISAHKLREYYKLLCPRAD